LEIEHYAELTLHSAKTVPNALFFLAGQEMAQIEGANRMGKWNVVLGVGITVAAVALAVLAFALSEQEGSTVSAGDVIPGDTCKDLPGHQQLLEELIEARNADNGGFDLDMWGTIINRDGVVCAVAFTGENRGDQWPGSRVISAQKANTANAFSLPDLALSTANLYTAVQPGGSLFGLQESNPVDTEAAYGGQAANYGQPNDPMVGDKIGGVNVFGGGLALYNSDGELLGAIGVSGDSSCADHAIAWRTRHALALDYVPNGVSGDPDRPDNIVYGAGAWAHPNCLDAVEEVAIANSLPAIP
jgi:uncharacterized protein GlcG (DUF336 family)